MKKLIFSLVLLFLFSGCSHELDTIGAVMGVAFDQPQEKKFNMTASILEAGEETAQVQNVSAEGNTVSEASMNCSLLADKKMFFGHNKIILLGEAFAKNGIEDLVTSFYQSADKRGAEQLVVCKGNAAEALAIEAITEDTAAESIAENIESAEKSTYISKCTLHEFAQKSLSAGRSVLVPMGRVNLNESGKTCFELDAMAVFRENSLIAVLTEDEARGAKWLTQGAQGDTFAVLNGETELLVTVTNSKIQVTQTEAGFLVTLSLDVSLRESLGNASEEIIAAEAVRLAYAAIHAAQRLEADFLDIGYHFPPENEDTWNKDLKNKEFAVSAHVTLRHSGMMADPLP